MASNMTNTAHATHDGQRVPGRLWFAVATVVVQWLFWIVVPIAVPSQMAVGLFGGIGCGLVVIVWWLFFSRAPWVERLGAIAVMVVAVVATSLVVHPSISSGSWATCSTSSSIPRSASRSSRRCC